jgi:hypothetical protein
MRQHAGTFGGLSALSTIAYIRAVDAQKPILVARLATWTYEGLTLVIRTEALSPSPGGKDGEIPFHRIKGWSSG